MHYRKFSLMLVFLIGYNVFAEFSTNLIRAGKPQKTTNKVVEVYGHRGARAFAPENSIVAYQTALKIGVDWVDMDIGITKDGEVVVYHDLWINPDFTSHNGKFLAPSNKQFISGMGERREQLIKPYLLNNLTFKELQQYDIGILNPDSPYGKYFPNQLAVNNTRIPSLQKVIDYVDGATNKAVMYQIEVKNDPLNPSYTVSSKEFAHKIYAILKQNNLIQRAEIQAFDWNVLYELQRLDKNIKTAYLIGYDEIDVKDANKFKHSGQLSGGKLLKDYNNSLPQMIKQLGGSCYEPEDVMLTKEDLDEAHHLGLKVVVWTWPEHSGSAFNQVLIDQLIDWGVDGIITDDPARLNAMLAVRGYKTAKNYDI